MVEDNVDARDGVRVRALVGLLGGGVGALEHDLAVGTGLVLERRGKKERLTLVWEA